MIRKILSKVQEGQSLRRLLVFYGFGRQGVPTVVTSRVISNLLRGYHKTCPAFIGVPPQRRIYIVTRWWSLSGICHFRLQDATYSATYLIWHHGNPGQSLCFDIPLGLQQMLSDHLSILQQVYGPQRGVDRDFSLCHESNSVFKLS